MLPSHSAAARADGRLGASWEARLMVSPDLLASAAHGIFSGRPWRQCSGSAIARAASRSSLRSSSSLGAAARNAGVPRAPGRAFGPSVSMLFCVAPTAALVVQGTRIVLGRGAQSVGSAPILRSIPPRMIAVITTQPIFSMV